MIDPNPAPTIPDLDANNTIDVEKLGTDRLLTYINYPDIKKDDGEWIVVNWRGCAQDGTAVDEFEDRAQIVEAEVTDSGLPVRIENPTVRLLDQGWAFYSYRVDRGGVQSEESKRIFFYVGKRPRAKPDLPVLQIKESQDLRLDVESLPGDPGVWAGPYEAMATGDTVTLHCSRFRSDGVEVSPPLEYSVVVKAEQVGKPLQLYLSKSDVRRVIDGHIELNYSIQYAGSPAAAQTRSAQQTIKLLEPTAPLLPALSIPGHTPGQGLNPSAFPTGVPVRINAYPGMSVGDQVFCYASAVPVDNEPSVQQVQVDASTIDKGSIEFSIDPQWFAKRNGEDIELLYQYSWIGTAMSSHSYATQVRAPLILPMPIVVGAVPESPVIPGQGQLDVTQLSVSGVTLRIDDNANFGPDDKVEMFWDGNGGTGFYSTSVPVTPGGRDFNIPPRYIPANFDRLVPVYYCVTLKGENDSQKSDVFNVRVLKLDDARYIGIQSKQAQQQAGRIIVSNVPPEGELFSFPQGWPYIHEGQILNAVMSGRNIAGQAHSFSIFDNHKITPEQAQDKNVFTYVSRAELQKFQPSEVAVQVIVTYETDVETKYRIANFRLAA
ncbi:hypothetical protein NYP20_16635 [Pseudomonas sp. N3-W]|jgi:hypothetical protein|uniref:Uncharacterized protein n=1 Tax=Pseudomonas fungipugnans TaxID=3024217 RepID=A0ABT6QXG6_9PSED|nr:MULTISPECIES: hypothetical protein [unclassified Pseudomonas]MDI2595513.1 hypothetical protein [Pseudomonas sp. 681]UWF46976.1 hypothetical protein NYP20_16635 [Pseudomonas sp. N3-W]